MFAKKPLIALILTTCSTSTWGDTTAEHTAQLPEITVTGTRAVRSQTLPFQHSRKASDMLIQGDVFKQRSATLGNALANEIGIHSNPFGGGASAPVIRGQEGVRVKILQNGSDVIDMSSLSPDHASVADTLLANQVEVVRGASTLLYATASPAGVVNIIDKRIPERVPAQGYEGELGAYWNHNAQEKRATAGITVGITPHLALRAEGLTRHADNYRVPSIRLGETLKYVPDTHNRSHVGTLGLSWIGDKGFLGASYSHRRDQYGLPGHNHMLDNCTSHIINPTKAEIKQRNYLHPYPHLMTDDDLVDSIHFHCGTEHADNQPHSHDNVYGHQHDHSSEGPWVDLISKRYDVRGEWRQPLAGIDKLRLSLAYADYFHDEKGDGKVYISPHDNIHLQKRKQEDARQSQGQAAATFANKGFNTRLELYHQPIGNLKGVWGIQYQTQKSRADRVIPSSRNSEFSLLGEREMSERHPLVANNNKQLSIFALENYRYRDWLFEASARFEQQSIPIKYDPQLLSIYAKPNMAQPDLSTYRQRAWSYAGSILWDFHPDYRLAFTASHNERLPTPMELYYHGKHLATNSFEYGNRHLQKERSNNFEIGLTHHSNRWQYKISTYYNRFQNHISNENLYRSGNLFARRYIQSKARYYGLEGEVSYQFNPQHQITLFGDMVRGKLSRFPKIYGSKIYAAYDCVDEDGWQDTCYQVVGRETVNRPDRHAPRVPPARLGLRFNSQFNPHWSSSVEYTRVFSQNRRSVSLFTKEKDLEEQREGARLTSVPVVEDKTKGYHLLNLGIHYHNKIGNKPYQISLNANNLLNQKMYIHNSYLPYVPQMGRNISLGVNLKF